VCVCACVVAEIFRINHICQRKNINKIYGTQCVLVRLCASAYAPVLFFCKLVGPQKIPKTAQFVCFFMPTAQFAVIPLARPTPVHHLHARVI